MDDWSFYDPLTLSEAAPTPDLPFDGIKVIIKSHLGVRPKTMSTQWDGPKGPFLSTFRVKMSTQRLVVVNKGQNLVDVLKE